ncbi:MAG: DUF1992 domain-containing protein [Phycisphaerales bacterium]
MSAWLLTERAIHRVADERIEAAMERGEFDRLVGRGRPIEDLDRPYDPNWWLRTWMKREAIRAPDAIE